MKVLYTAGDCPSTIIRGKKDTKSNDESTEEHEKERIDGDGH